MRRTPSIPRSFLVLTSLACALSLVAGTALSQIAFPEPAASTPHGTKTPEARLITRFYAAVNDALRTGNGAALNDLVAADFVEHPARPGSPPGRDGFVAALATLRVVFPALQLMVEDVRSLGDHVAARVRLEGAAGSFLGIPLGSAQVPWGPIGLFRVADGRVVEHWGVPAHAAHMEPVTQAPLAMPGDGQWRVTLDRRDYAGNTVWMDEVAAGPLLLLGQSGTLAVAIERADQADALLVHTSAPGQRRGSGEPIRAGDIATIVPGDLLVIPRGSRFTSANDGSTPASVSVLTLTQPVVPGGAPAEPPALPNGITTRPLVWGPALSVPEEVIVRIGRMMLGPGAEIPMHDVSGLELVLVESGALLLSAAEQPAWVRQGTDGWSSAETMSTLAGSDGALVAPGTMAAYRSTSEASPVSALVITIMPA